MRSFGLLVVALVVLAGCGGDNGGSKEAYTQAGNAICSRYQTAIGKLGQPKKLSDIGPYIGRALPVLERTVGEIEKLDPPGDLSDQYAKFRDAARGTVGRAQALRRAAEQSDGAEVQALLKEASRASRDRVGLARAAGLETCAKL